MNCCRYKGFYEFAKAKGLNLGSPVGLDVVVDGIVPTGTCPSTITLCLYLLYHCPREYLRMINFIGVPLI